MCCRRSSPSNQLSDAPYCRVRYLLLFSKLRPESSCRNRASGSRLPATDRTRRREFHAPRLVGIPHWAPPACLGVSVELVHSRR